MRHFLIVISVVAVFMPAASAFAQDGVSKHALNDIPAKSKTSLGLYLDACGAAAWLKEQPDVKLIDIRTPEEFVYVGHPPMAWNIPLMTNQLKKTKDGATVSMTMNPEFVERVQEIAEKDEPFIFICRSGARSVYATNLLAKNGFTNVYHVIDGFEGDKLRDPTHPDNGKRVVNGWKNACLAWTYDVEPSKMLLPMDEKGE